jgi:hypothetical protein
MRNIALAIVMAGCASNASNPSQLWLDSDDRPSRDSAFLTAVEPAPFQAPGTGLGEPCEAAFDLVASVPAGTYHVVADALIIGSVDVTYDLIWRSPKHGDNVLATLTKTYEEAADPSVAQLLEYNMTTPTAIAYEAGDQFVWRYTGSNGVLANNGGSGDAYYPNSDGNVAGPSAQIPNITLPQ